MTGKCMLKDIASFQVLKYRDKGVYILRMCGAIMKVGSAKIGIKKRMQQYYNLNKWCGLNEFINYSNRNTIEVEFQTCSIFECRELETKLFDKYGINNMPWAKRRPHSKNNRCKLLI